MKKILSYDGWQLIIIGLVGGLLSFLLYDFIWRFIILLIGLIVLFWGISYLMFSINQRNYKQDNAVKPAIKSALLIFIGISLIIPWSSWIIQFIVGLACGIYLLVNCLIRLYNAEDKKMQFKKDLVKYILGLLIIVLGIQNSGKYIAIAFFAFILVCGIISLIMDNKNKKQGYNEPKSSTKHDEINEVEYYVDDNQE